MWGADVVYANTNINGFIVGVVSSNETPMEEVEITVRNLDTNTTKTTQTSETGKYEFSHLVPGEYEITASAPGYKRVSQSATVYTGSRSSIHFSLEPGDMEELVVTGGKKWDLYTFLHKL